ncbi:MAG: carbamoyltransferase C-terminal domain-containing protein [Acidobacteriota bacterium]|nr:carbamoyltransferase C-terminal domain-containing protein [Acidobacteriota bacterium]
MGTRYDNIRGEPIVESPRQAYQCFMGTGLDFLIIENCFLDKKGQN